MYLCQVTIVVFYMAALSLEKHMAWIKDKLFAQIYWAHVYPVEN